MSGEEQLNPAPDCLDGATDLIHGTQCQQSVKLKQELSTWALSIAQGS